MDLGVPGPFGTADIQPRVEKVRTGITVVLSRGYYLNGAGFPVAQAPALKEQVFPQPVEELFFHDR